jgi:peroxiredoxin
MCKLFSTAKLFVLAGLVSMVITLSPHIAQAVPAPGELAPDFTATDSEGNTQKLRDQKGSIVVLEWTNHDCPFVRKHYGSGNMQALQKEANEQDIVWWSVISSAPGKQGHVSPDQANELTNQRNAAPSAVLLDPEGTIGELYGARTTPHMYVIDPEGELVYMGAIDDIPSANESDVETANNYVRMALTAAQKGQPAEPATTQPYGCSVKY